MVVLAPPSLIKAGPGTQILSGEQTYTGPTTVAGGGSNPPEGSVATEADRLGCEPEGGALFVGESGVAQPIVGGADLVAVLHLPGVGRGEADRDAERSEELLVALEHARERLIRLLVVAGNGATDGRGAEAAAEALERTPA